MEIFDNVFDALKEVKRLSEKLEHTHEQIYLVYNQYYNDYIVTTDDAYLEYEIKKRWKDSSSTVKNFV